MQASNTDEDVDGQIASTDQIMAEESANIFDHLRSEVIEAHGEPVYEDEAICIHVDHHTDEYQAIADHTDGVDRDAVATWMWETAIGIPAIGQEASTDPFKGGEPLVLLKTSPDINKWV